MLIGFFLFQPRAEYDFIVVGGGSAGAVVASRLSEVSNWTVSTFFSQKYVHDSQRFFQVLLLEAGGDENEISDIPTLASYTQMSNMDWMYQTDPPGPSPYCLAMVGDRCNWPRGKVLGGSSVLNAMLYVRGNRHDYDHWETLGNEGWNFQNVLHYFIKSEDNR